MVGAFVVAVGATHQVSAIGAATGTIIVQVDAQPNDTQPFSFTASGGLSPASFTLAESMRGDVGSRTFSGVNPESSYSVAESVPAGWDLASATCSNGSPVTDIHVAVGETVTCTFTNRLQTAATMTVRLDTIPDDAGRFLYRISGPTRINSCNCFVLQDNGDPFDGDNNVHSFQLKPGSGYKLSLARSEGGPWTPLSASCSDGSSPTSIDISPNENITCSFSYQKQG